MNIDHIIRLSKSKFSVEMYLFLIIFEIIMKKIFLLTFLFCISNLCVAQEQEKTKEQTFGYCIGWLSSLKDDTKVIKYGGGDQARALLALHKQELNMDMAKNFSLQYSNTLFEFHQKAKEDRTPENLIAFAKIYKIGRASCIAIGVDAAE